MEELTERQREVLAFIEKWINEQGHSPSFRDVADFLDANVTAAADHLRSLKRKGYIRSVPGRARSLQITTPFRDLRRSIIDVPLYGSIPAGFARDRKQEAKGCISVDVETLGIRPTARTFALEVKGDSMIGKHILDGDFIILEHGLTPRPGDVVAALIDRESTLKTYVMERGKPYLRAENPKFPSLHPADELVIQGVMIALIRRQKHRK